MIGVFVARMQPLHKSHEYLIRESLKDNDKTYVFVGSADKARNKRNPFTIEERMDLIGKVFAKEIGEDKLFLIPLNDLSNENDLENDKAWGQYLYDNITNTIKEDTFTIYYSDEPSIMLNWFDDDLKWKICFKFYDRAELFSTLSATKIREALLNDNIDYLKASLPDEVFMEREKLASILRTI